MQPIRFQMIGGFLGAGKTTAIGRLARLYMDQGLNVGIVTNDQAYDLVDTQSLRAQGFRVGEVPGACFCCKFDDLVATAAQLAEDEAPDVVITEPVGSCTDLVATVIEPLRHLHGDAYEISPLAVLLKPEHGLKILGGEQNVGFSPKAAYIFLKQLEEADIVVINKIDKLSPDEREELIALVAARFPYKDVVCISAREGDGFEDLVEAIKQPHDSHCSLMDIDYDVYAEGEAELGWLNCSVGVQSSDPFSLDDALVQLVRQLGKNLDELQAEVAHLKVFGQDGSDSAMANLVGGGVDADLSLASEIDVSEAELIVNARVAVDPEILEDCVRQTVQKWAEQFGLRQEITGMQRFRPGRPIPTHRVTA